MGALDLHYRLLEQMKNERGDRRTAVAISLVGLAHLAAQAYRDEYPGEPLPVNPAFTRAAIDLEQVGDYRAAMRVCQQALTSGWKEEPHRIGDWDHRLTRLKRKLGQ